MSTNLDQNWQMIKSGKIRDIYASPDHSRIALVAGDGVSAFDQKLNVTIPGKGRILTKMSAFWFDLTGKSIPSAYITHDNDQLPPNLTGPLFRDRTTIMHNLQMFPIECIVRGYITGSAWQAYQDGVRNICGNELPENLRNCYQLPEPIYTPTTKSAQHDENVTFEETVDIIKAAGLGGFQEAAQLRAYALSLYRECSAYALEKGIIIADAKFEFGLNSAGVILVADELLTPDSSRFWLSQTYEPGHEQASLDKQIIRNYLKSEADHGRVCTSLPDYILARTQEQYERVYQLLAGPTK